MNTEQSNSTFTKGKRVVVETTNGGRTIATLAEDYRETYAIVLDGVAGPMIIPAWRIARVRLPE